MGKKGYEKRHNCEKDYSYENKDYDDVGPASKWSLCHFSPPTTSFVRICDLPASAYGMRHRLDKTSLLVLPSTATHIQAQSTATPICVCLGTSVVGRSMPLFEAISHEIVRPILRIVAFLANPTIYGCS